MGREERKLKKDLQQGEITERRKLAQKQKQFKDKGRNSEPDAGAIEGLVIRTGPASCIVRTESGERRYRSEVDAAIGDRVSVSPSRSRVEQVLPRSTVLSRPDPHNPRIQLVIAANIDLVVNVVSLRSPPLRPGLIDRYLIAIEQSGAEPLLCINKTDLQGEDDDLESELRPYLDLGVPMVRCSATTGHGMDELRSALANKKCVFAGHSGVGKSSLLNALDPALDAIAGDVSARFNKGRHTTTSSRMYELANGAVIIDTPGIRELGLWNVSPEMVRRYFHEFDEFSAECAFSDCSHTHEPRCAVKKALDDGLISQARYASYRRVSASSGALEVGP